jgi:hypothetical protein
MSARITVRLVGVALVLALGAPVALGYIHFPPMTLQKMCMTSTHVRVLSVKKYDRKKGIVLFELVKNLKGPALGPTFRHVVRTDAAGVRPILDWLGDGKRAVMFTIESAPPGTGIACGYVFIDDYCYSVDHNRRGDYWLLIRAEPNMSACYHGPADKLHKLAKAVLDGKAVKVPVKEPTSPLSKKDRDKRVKEVTDVLTKNRSK